MDEERTDDLGREDGVRAADPTATEGLPGDETSRLREELAAYHAELEAQHGELREAQQQLEESHNRYFHLFEAAPIGYLIVDRQGVIRELNRAAVEMLGLPRPLLVGRVLAATIDTDDLPAFLAHHKEAMDCDHQVNADVRIRRPDGTRVSALVSSQRIKPPLSPAGEILVTLTNVSELKAVEERLRAAERELRQEHRVATVELDITQRRLAQESAERSRVISALRTTEQQYQVVVEYANEGIVVTQDGRFRFVNQQVCEILGWSVNELLEMEFVRFVHPGDRETVTRHHVRRIRGEEAPEPYNFRIVDNHGRVRWVRNNAVLIQWEGRPGVLSLLSDITNEKELARRLVDERELLRTILENIPVLVSMADLQGKVLLVNREFERVLGWSKADLEKSDAVQIPPAPQQSHVHSLSSSRPGQWADIECRTLSGETVATSWTSVQLPDGSMIHIGLDVGDLRRAEQELQEAYVRLEAEHGLLERKNIALREVLAMFEKKRIEVRESVALNIDQAVLPKLHKIKQKTKNATVCRQLEVLEGELTAIASPLMSRLRLRYTNLTPREKQVARMISRGVATSEIARLLGLSVLTVQKHRELIRKRLGLTGSRTNLEAYLKTLGTEVGGLDGLPIEAVQEDGEEE